MPISSNSFLLCSGSMVIFTPSASRQSAAPDLELAARLPCLATGTPAAEITMDAVVEILKELELSPPVPTISSASTFAPSFLPNFRISSAEPVISSMVSPFWLNAVK